MGELREILDPGEKAAVCDATLRALPDWFGSEESIVEYVAQARAMPFYAAFDGGAPLGFAALKAHSPYAAEIELLRNFNFARASAENAFCRPLACKRQDLLRN